jgi:hypothetical protein
MLSGNLVWKYLHKFKSQNCVVVVQLYLPVRFVVQFASSFSRYILFLSNMLGYSIHVS